MRQAHRRSGLSRSELGALMRAADISTPLGLRDLLLLNLIAAGVTQAEAVAIRVEDVDLPHGLITYHRTPLGKLQLALGKSGAALLRRYVAWARPSLLLTHAALRHLGASFVEDLDPDRLRRFLSKDRPLLLAGASSSVGGAMNAAGLWFVFQRLAKRAGLARFVTGPEIRQAYSAQPVGIGARQREPQNEPNRQLDAALKALGVGGGRV